MSETFIERMEKYVMDQEFRRDSEKEEKMVREMDEEKEENKNE